MRHFHWPIILSVLMVNFGVRQTRAQPLDVASVKALVSDSFGRSVHGATVTLTSIGPNQKFTRVGGEASFAKIPFGLYNVRVQLPGFLPRNEQIRVYQPNLVLKIGLELVATHSYERPVLSGSVSGDLKGRSDLWVRLVSLYSSDLVENNVDASGKFDLEGMAPGKYLLILLEKDQVLSMRPVDILEGKQEIEPEFVPPKEEK